MPKTAPSAESELSPLDLASSCADTLLRAATECARQHERLGRCLERAGSDDELRHIAALTELTDAHLATMTAQYETAATAAPAGKETPWWHAANSLWHASREYSRRLAGTDRVTRLLGKHSKEKLTQLTMEYELERSALIALKQAVANYRALRPDAE